MRSSHGNKRKNELEASEVQGDDGIKKKSEKSPSHQDIDERISHATNLFRHIGLIPEPDYLAIELAKNNNVFQFALKYFNQAFFSACTYDEIQFFIEKLLEVQHLLTLNDALKICPATTPRSFYATLHASFSDFSELEDVFNALTDPSKKIDLMCAFSACIKNSDILATLLVKLPIEFRFDAAYILRDKIRNTKELCTILDILPEESRFDLANELRLAITDCEQLHSILHYLPEHVREVFAYILRDAIKSSAMLLLTAALLPVEARLDFICNVVLECTIPSNFTQLLSSMRDDAARVTTIGLIQARIKTISQLANAIHVFPKSDGFHLAAEFIHNAKDLAELLSKLPDPIRYDFALEFSKFIVHSDDAAIIIALLPVKQRIQYIELLESFHAAQSRSYFLRYLLGHLSAAQVEASVFQAVAKMAVSADAITADEMISYIKTIKSNPDNGYKVADEVFVNKRVNPSNRGIFYAKVPPFLLSARSTSDNVR